MQRPRLSAAAVAELARVSGHGEIDAELAARVAAGASNAIEAVVASLEGSLFDTEPGNYREELERLAEPAALPPQSR